MAADGTGAWAVRAVSLDTRGSLRDSGRVFGIVRPCRHRLRRPLFGEWTSHLCGLCLALRDLHGQSARLVTNYDGLLVSVLTDAQRPDAQARRTAGPCVLRGMRRAVVVGAEESGERLAAAVSLILAAGKISDHVADRDGVYARRLVAARAGLAARRWEAAGVLSAAALGFDAAVLAEALARQGDVERAPGLSLLEVTEPTETAVAAVFAHTAILAGKPGNAGPLAEAGRFFGRIAHLLDAAQDLAADQASGAYNPLTATGATWEQARQHCEQAMLGLRLAVADLDLERRELVDALLVGEVARSIGRVFAHGPQSAVARFGGWLPACPGLAGAAGHTDRLLRRKFGCRDCWFCCEICDCCSSCSC